MTTRRILHIFHKQLSLSRIHAISSTHPRILCNIYNHSFGHFSSEIQSIKNDNDDDDENEYEYETETETESENEYESGDEEESEEEEQFEYGIDSDDEFSENLPYDVREDPYWNDMLPATQQKYLFMQRHKNPEAWPDQIIPHAVKTDNFGYRTIKAVKRFPNLSKYAQSYTENPDGRWNWDIKNVKLNTVKQMEEGLLYNQPKYKQIMPMIHKKEVAAWKNDEIDYKFKAGDVIEVVMYTNLQKKKTQKTTALCLMVKKKFEIAGSFMIRNCEKDGLTVIRQFPLHSPWIKSIKIVQRYKVKRRRLYYMYNAPATETDPVAYGESIGVRSRSEHFKWLKTTEEGLKYARDYKLKRRMYFHGMRYRQGWARRLANLYNATAMTKNMKGPMRNARREMKYRLRAKPHKIA